MGGRGATSSHGKTKTKEKPRQKGHLTGDQIPKTHEDTAKYLGVSVQEAKDMYGAVKDFSGTSYSLMRAAQRGEKVDAKYKRLAEQAEGYIKNAPKWGGGVTYRGISLPASVVQSLKVGGTFDVNLGDDTDTTAAVAGGLAGIVYGIDAIPAEWIAGLRGKDVIDACLFA